MDASTGIYSINTETDVHNTPQKIYEISRDMKGIDFVIDNCDR